MGNLSTGNRSPYAFLYKVVTVRPWRSVTQHRNKTSSGRQTLRGVKKAKFALEQDEKAQRMSRGIDLFFL
jgi:hypothetical protein